MKNRFLLAISTVSLIALVNLVPAGGQSLTAAGKTVDTAWRPERSADGQPDINRSWTNYDATPFEAPDPEDAARLAALRQWFPPGDQTGARDFGAADGPGSAPRNARRKAMVVDPESGRVPVRPEAAAKKDDALAHLTDSWENHTPWERCITRGVPGGIFPGLYGAGYQIVQGPGVVAIRYEMIHGRASFRWMDAPIFRRASASGMAIRVGTGKAIRSSSISPTTTTRARLPPISQVRPCEASARASNCTSSNASRLSTRTPSTTKSRSMIRTYTSLESRDADQSRSALSGI